ncbi:MAG: LysM peptidoglycan-binding domain-containing protein [Gemmatimonadota bacterium]|jgi:hypothetical protein
MIRSATVLLALVLMSGLAAPPAASQEAAQTHEVRSGETLWSLAARYYQDGRLWRRIFEANRDRLDDPADLDVGLVLTIPGLQGGAVEGVTVETPEPAVEPETQPPAEPAAEARPMARLEPQEGRGPKPIARRTVMYPDTANPTLAWEEAPPLSAVSPDIAYSAPWLVRGDRPVDRSGVVVGFVGAEGEASRRGARPHERVLIRFDGSPPPVGSLLQVFRAERGVPEVGTVVEPTGVIRIESVESVGAVGVVEKLFRRLAPEDAVGPLPPYEVEPGQAPASVTGGPEVEVLGFAEDRPLYSIGDVVFLDVGSDETRIGDEYAVVIPSGQDWSAAAEGRLQVIGVHQDHAVARITAEESPLLGTRVRVRLDRRMR